MDAAWATAGTCTCNSATNAGYANLPTRSFRRYWRIGDSHGCSQQMFHIQILEAQANELFAQFIQRTVRTTVDRILGILQIASDKPNTALLSMASAYGYAEVVRELLKHGTVVVDVNEKTNRAASTIN